MTGLSNGTQYYRSWKMLHVYDDTRRMCVNGAIIALWKDTENTVLRHTFVPLRNICNVFPEHLPP